ncbi:MAG: cation-translocating P-type ATPase [Anaerolineales bacterium]|nr:cation-translocating P-type ATPase [Anaerolineales bacterium]
MVLHDMIVGGGIYARELMGWASPETAWLVHFFQIMMLVSSIPVLILLGLPILRAGFASLLRGQPNIHTLIMIGTFSAFGLSVRNLAGTDPNQATVVTNNQDSVVNVAELKPGMRVRVRPGERFPVDGLIAIGEGDVDESLLTGEPKPVTHHEGDKVQAGTVNLDGSFEVIATAVGSSTTAGQIGRLLHEALWARSPLERMVDKLSAWMTPLALALATIAFLIWYTISGLETWFDGGAVCFVDRLPVCAGACHSADVMAVA